MLTPITNPDPALTAPLAMLHIAENDFPETIRLATNEVARNREEGNKRWSDATYLPMRHLRAILDESGEAEGTPAHLSHNVAATLAVALAWSQSKEVVEVSRHAYYEAIATSNPLKGFPVDRLKSLSRQCICFSTSSLRLSEGVNSPQLLTIFGCVDEFQTPSGKAISELTIAYLFNRPAERQFVTKVTTLPMSAGLSFEDTFQRSEHSSSTSGATRQKGAPHQRQPVSTDGRHDALQLTIIVNMLLLVSDGLGTRPNPISRRDSGGRGAQTPAITILELERAATQTGRNP